MKLTPEQKAIELFNKAKKYCFALRREAFINNRKSIANMVCDEILNNPRINFVKVITDYYEEVKREIEKL